MPPPSLENFISPSEFESLQRLTEEQQNEISRLSNLLGPLSPSGRIPGLDDQGNPNTSYFDNTDFDQFINSNALSDPSGLDTGEFNGLVSGTDGADFNFMLDGSGGDLLGNSAVPATTPATAVGNVNGNNISKLGASGFEHSRVYEANSPADSPSPAHTEEIPRNEVDFGALSPERDTKRRRRQ